MKCTKEQYAEVAAEDIVSARVTDFSAEILVSDREASERKYSGIVFDNASLDDIMQYYVHRSERVWT